jgi:hypothetical protein
MQLQVSMVFPKFTLYASVEKLKARSVRRCILYRGRLPAQTRDDEESTFYKTDRVDDRLYKVDTYHSFSKAIPQRVVDCEAYSGGPHWAKRRCDAIAAYR